MTPVENSTFSPYHIRKTDYRLRGLAPEQQAESEELGRKIAQTVRNHQLIGRRRYQEIQDGHLRTFTVGEERTYDTTRRLYTTQLTILVEETTRFKGRYGIEEVLGKVQIAPYRTPLTCLDVKETEPSGGIGECSSAHASTPDELKAILDVLLNGAKTDPRNTNWQAVASVHNS